MSLRLGDEVAWAPAFLRAIEAPATSELWTARGAVVEVVSPRYVRVRWAVSDRLQLVAQANLTRARPSTP